LTTIYETSDRKHVEWINGTLSREGYVTSGTRESHTLSTTSNLSKLLSCK